jgi:hypothetical protein
VSQHLRCPASGTRGQSPYGALRGAYPIYAQHANRGAPPPEPRLSSSRPVLIAPLTPVSIEAFFPEVTPNEAPPPTEVPPDATPAAPIEVLPTFDTDDNPMPRQKVPAVFEPTEAVVPRQNIHPPDGSHDARVELDRLFNARLKPTNPPPLGGNS